jgi:DNA-binding transcriptional LysR family regulator
MAINELRAIATFDRAAELGSLRRAAAAQGITPQAASQALGQLEHHLGVRLFHRTTRRLALTEEGRQFLNAAQPGLTALRRAIQGARRGREEMAGPLRIAAPRSNSAHVLWPLIAAFGRRHPEVELDISLDDRISDWVEERVDVGFRGGLPPQEGLIARRLYPLQLIVCAAPDYLARHGAPRSIEELAQHRCSGYRLSSTGKLASWDFKVGDDIVSHMVAPALSTNDLDLEAGAVLEGLVIGQTIGLAVAEHIRAGRLVPLLTQHVTDHLGLYLYYGSRVAQPTRVRAFIDFIIERLKDPPFILTAKELASAEAKGLAASRRARAPARARSKARRKTPA